MQPSAMRVSVRVAALITFAASAFVLFCAGSFVVAQLNWTRDLNGNLLAIEYYEDLFKTSWLAVLAPVAALVVTVILWIRSAGRARRVGGPQRFGGADVAGWTLQVMGVAAGVWLFYYATEWRFNRGSAPGVPFDWRFPGENAWRWFVGPAVGILALVVGFLVRKAEHRRPQAEVRRGLLRGLNIAVWVVVLLITAIFYVVYSWGLSFIGWTF